MAQLTTKQELEEWYEKPDPWGFNNTFVDRVRRRIFLDHLVSPLATGTVARVLDAGCGEGFLTRDLAASHDIQIDAFDISQNAIDSALKQNAATNIHYFALDLRDFEPTQEYDLIICEEALYYLEDDERATVLVNFGRALSGDGFLKLSVVAIGENEHRRYFTPQSIQTVLADCDFRVLSILPSVVGDLQFVHRILFAVLSRVYRVTGWAWPLGVAKAVVLTYPNESCYQLSILAEKTAHSDRPDDD